MTLKHIEFYDSEVMRSLAREAIKSGKLPIKQASLDTPSISGNLVDDLVLLAEKLRDKGYVKEAQNLETKILNYKFAEQEFSAELSAAHPDGDVEIIPASDGLGEVETLESAHKKMVEVVNKNPKHAILTVVQDILKVAGPEEFGQFMGNGSEVLNKIETINSILAGKIPEMVKQLKFVNNTLETATFDVSRITLDNQPYLNLYAQYAGLAPETIVNFFNLWNNVYGLGITSDAQIILSKMLPLNQNDLKAFADKIESGVFDRFFPKPKQELQTGVDSVTQSVKNVGETILKAVSPVGWVYSGGEWLLNMSKASEQLKALAVELNNKMINQYNALVGQAKVKAAVTGLRELLSKPHEKVEMLQKQLSVVAPLEKTTSTNSVLLSQLNVIKEIFSSFLNEEAKDNSVYTAITVLFDKNIIIQPLAVTQGTLNDLINKIGSLPLSEADRIIPESETSGLSESFLNSAVRLKDYVEKTIPKDSKQYTDYVEDIKLLWGVSKVLKTNANRSYLAIFEELQQFLPKATSLAKLQQLAKGYGGAVDKLTGNVKATKKKSDLEKFSQRLNPGETPTSATPVASRGTLGLAKSNMGDAKEAATALMQQYLAYFAEALAGEKSKTKFTNYNPADVALIVRTGPKANPAVNTYDGKWGTQTQAALNVAKTYLDQLGLTGLDTNARYVNKQFASDTEAAAKQNAALLNRGTQSLGKGGFDSDSAPVRYGRVNGVYILNTDLASLANFYKFCIKNGLLKEEARVNEQGGRPETGVSLQGFMSVLDAVVSNAKEVYSKASALSARYYQDAINRWRELLDLIKQYGFDTTDSTLLLPADILPKTNEKGLTTGEKGIGSNNRETGPTIGANYQGGVDEGDDWSGVAVRKTGYPIDPSSYNIDLNSGWYPGFVRKTEIPTTLLGYNMFSSYPGNQLMYSFFPGAPDGKKKYYEFLNYLNKMIAEAIKKWMNDPRTKPNQDARAKMMEIAAAWREVILGQIQDLGFQVG